MVARKEGAQPGNRNSRKHGHTGMRAGRVWKSLTYHSWEAMNDRCYSGRHKWFDAYGGRGITVCERWRRGEPNAFVNFLADMGERPSKPMTLDRIDVDGNYELHKADGTLQCRWATKSEQRINQRNKANGHTQERRNAGSDNEGIEAPPY